MDDLENLANSLNDELYEFNLEIDHGIHVTVRKEEPQESPETSLNLASKEGNIFLLLFTTYPTLNQTQNNTDKLDSARIELIYDGEGEAEDVRIEQLEEVINIYHHVNEINDEEVLREQLRLAYQMSYTNQISDRKILIEGLSENLDKRLSESYYVILDALSQLVEENAEEFNKKYKEKNYSEVLAITESLKKLGDLNTPTFLETSLKTQLNKHSIAYLAWEIIAKTSHEFSKDLSEDAKYLKSSKEHALSKNAQKLSKFYAEIAEMADYSSRMMKTFLGKETETFKTLHGIELSTPPIQEILSSLLEKTRRKQI